MKLTLENLLIESWWPQKVQHWPNLLGQLCICGLNFPGCLPQYKINEFPLTWLIVWLAVWTYDWGSCTSQQTQRRTLPFCTSNSQLPVTAPVEICLQTQGGWRESVVLRNCFSARRCYRQGQLLLHKPLLTHRSWKGYRWQTIPSVQHHQRRGSANYI